MKKQGLIQFQMYIKNIRNFSFYSTAVNYEITIRVGVLNLSGHFILDVKLFSTSFLSRLRRLVQLAMPIIVHATKNVLKNGK